MIKFLKIVWDDMMYVLVCVFVALIFLQFALVVEKYPIVFLSCPLVLMVWYVNDRWDRANRKDGSRDNSKTRENTWALTREEFETQLKIIKKGTYHGIN